MRAMIMLTAAAMLAGCTNAEAERREQQEAKRAREKLEARIADVLCGRGSMKDRGFALAKIIEDPAYDDRNVDNGDDAYSIAADLQERGCPAALTDPAQSQSAGHQG